MTNPDLPDSVRRLVEAVNGFLNSSDGNDDDFIEAMQGCIDEIERDVRFGKMKRPAPATRRTASGRKKTAR
jgi:hypothetical protein